MEYLLIITLFALVFYNNYKIKCLNDKVFQLQYDECLRELEQERQLELKREILLKDLDDELNNMNIK